MDAEGDKMYYVTGAGNLRDKINDLLTDHFGDKAEVRFCTDGKVYVKVKENAGFKDVEEFLSKEELEQGVCGGGIVKGMDGKVFKIDVTEVSNWPWDQQ